MVPSIKNERDFRLEALCDFPDDAEKAPVPITPEQVDSFIQLLKQMGVTRIAWEYYADHRGGYVLAYDQAGDYPYLARYKAIADSYKLLSNPLAQAVKAGHKHGIEMYGYFKPYETGPGALLPDGAPEAEKFGKLQKIGGKNTWFDPFVLENPELRIKRRSDDIPADNDTRPVASIKLRKSNDLPTRISRKHLQIWVSSDNYQYKPADVPFEVCDSVEIAQHDINSMVGTLYTVHAETFVRKGDKIRTLTISGLQLTDPYILVTTDFKDGEPDFYNTAIEMMRAYDEQDKEIIGVFCNGNSIYHKQMVDFRNWGMIFDHGYGKLLGTLDNDNRSGKCGVIALTRGRNEYLDCALCETEPKVQQFWLDNIRKLLAMGVDGIEFRIENHSTMTQYPQDYGYNQVILDKLSDPENPAPQEIAKVRGDAYTEFLQQAKSLVDAKNKKMRNNLQMDFFRPAVLECRKCAYPGNVDFQWQRWVDLGLMHQAVFRYYAYILDEIIDDEYAAAITEYCLEKDIPVTFNRYLCGYDVPEFLPRDLMRVYEDGRFSGFIFYELADIFNYNSDSTVSIKMPEFLEAINLIRSNTSHIS